jgi:hypothetical protein
MNKMRWLKVFFMVLVLCTISSSAFSRPVWIEGIVTRSPWPKDGYHYIEVDKQTYRLLPGIRITYRYKRNKRAFNEEKASVNSLYTGHQVSMKINKKDVLQIIRFQP